MGSVPGRLAEDGVCDMVVGWMGDGRLARTRCWRCRRWVARPVASRSRVAEYCAFGCVSDQQRPWAQHHELPSSAHHRAPTPSPSPSGSTSSSSGVGMAGASTRAAAAAVAAAGVVGTGGSAWASRSPSTGPSPSPMDRLSVPGPSTPHRSERGRFGWQSSAERDERWPVGFRFRRGV